MQDNRPAHTASCDEYHQHHPPGCCIKDCAGCAWFHAGLKQLRICPHCYFQVDDLGIGVDGVHLTSCPHDVTFNWQFAKEHLSEEAYREMATRGFTIDKSPEALAEAAFGPEHAVFCTQDHLHASPDCCISTCPGCDHATQGDIFNEAMRRLKACKTELTLVKSLEPLSPADAQSLRQIGFDPAMFGTDKSAITIYWPAGGDQLDACYFRVAEFHRVFNHPIGLVPHELERMRAGARIAWMYEEIEEFEKAMDAHDLPEQADAMIDLIYFALGTLVEMGIKPGRLFDIVHEANMSKLWPDGTPHLREGDGKTLKPPTWVDPAPRTRAEIERQTEVAGVKPTQVDVP